MPNTTASAATHVTELPIVSADAAESEFNYPSTNMLPLAPLKPPRVSFPGSAAGPVQSEFYSSSSEQYYSEVKH